MTPLRGTTMTFGRALLLLAAMSLSGCSFKPDPDVDRFGCSADPDCGDGFVCKIQVPTGKGKCFRPAECSPETCDGADNDCDGVVDNAPSEVGVPCESELKGECKPGRQDCVNGVVVCVGGKPKDETCNLKDDDCDGNIDQTFDLTSDNENCGVCGHLCAAGSECRASECHELTCGDTLDNDGDGEADCVDPDCAGQACDPDDAALNCGRDASDVLFCVPREADCANDVDDDKDGLKDCADPDCAGRACSTSDLTLDCGRDGTDARACVAKETVCDDGLDDDGDGKTDCEDADCEGLACVKSGGGAGTCSALACN